MATSINIFAERASGVLLPVFSLPAPGGMGDLGPAACRFIDFLERAGQSFWQILPPGPTTAGAGHSPYMSASALAGNPLFISPELLVRDGLLEQGQIASPNFSPYTIDYAKAATYREHLLALAWEQAQSRAEILAALDEFIAASPWAVEYGLYLALKAEQGETAWFQWPEPLRLRKKTALAAARKRLHEEIRQHCFYQYLFCAQWQELRRYANTHGVRLIGDLPIYVAMDSVDVWAHQEIFDLDSRTGEATRVAGVPPDYFSETGQRWGNPLYRWNAPEKGICDSLYAWWEERLRRNLVLADCLRLDHFRGFEAYWAVPAEEETAINGAWRSGPGLAFFGEMEHRLGNLPLIAEDLGVITPEVEKLRDTLGLPGMKILLFAFDGNPKNSYLPYNCPANSVIYTGTHDNETAVGWYLNPDTPESHKRLARRFSRSNDDHAGSFHTDLIYLAMSSPSRLAIFPMQDLLGFGNDCRTNTPGVASGNWVWRCPAEHFNNGLADWLRDLTSLFGRLPVSPEKEDADDGHSAP